MSEELKPCPFCGDTPTGDAHTLTQGFKYGAIECGCGAIGPDVRTGYEDWPAWKEAAAKEWNERAELAALKAGQGEAVAPYGYLREVDGNVQLSVGPARPADRSGGCATPWSAIFADPAASADAVSVAPGLERAIQIVREVAKTQPGYSDEREAIFEALSEAYAEAKAPASADAVSVPVELLMRLTKRVMLRSQEEAHADACDELRALLARQEVK